jgi:hypothetical protein
MRCLRDNKPGRAYTGKPDWVCAFPIKKTQLGIWSLWSTEYYGSYGDSDQHVAVWNATTRTKICNSFQRNIFNLFKDQEKLYDTNPIRCGEIVLSRNSNDKYVLWRAGKAEPLNRYGNSSVIVNRNGREFAFVTDSQVIVIIASTHSIFRLRLLI